MAGEIDRDPEFLAFIELFNRGEYAASAERLVPLWQATQDPFYKGLIQLAGAMSHWEDGSFFWAADLLASGHNLLQPYAPVHDGIDVDDLLERVRHAHALAEAARRAPAGEQPPLPSIPLRPA
ncbi:MAG TPA: DUF309 domain-containing protein [Limnochordia bacterium]